jgi:peptidoglycan hydrolase CwlO-like protein
MNELDAWASSKIDSLEYEIEQLQKYIVELEQKIEQDKNYEKKEL